MGLISAGIGAVTSTMSDMWKEFFYCDSLDKDVLVVKGQKRTGRHSGGDNIITSGSGIVVADGQCMIIVEQGKIVEVCAEPGQYTYDNTIAPTVFSGSLGDGIMNTFKEIGKRFTYGGGAAADQRVYYFNTKEIMGNKFGTATPIPFRVVDTNIGLDIDVSVRCNGVYSYRIADPLLFYANVCGNVDRQYTRSEIDGQLKPEFISALQPSFGQISAMGVRPSALPAHVTELCDAMNHVLTSKWNELRGIQVVSIAINSVTLPEEDAEIIKTAQKSAILRNPEMAAAALAGAQADAMRAAASNANGAMAGFMGMNMAQQAGGFNAQQLYGMGQQYQQQQYQQQQYQQQQYQQPQYQQQQYQQSQYQQPQQAAPQMAAPSAVSGEWTCTCGAVNTGKFCQECGSKRPAPARFRCDKCGWEPADPTNPPKFCPECGDPFNAGDIVG